MSSINGIVDRDRKNTDFGVLREMGRATVLRGADQSGAYINGNIGLYFNRFVGDGDEEARQPYTVSFEGKNYTVMIDGDIKGDPRSCAEAVMECYLSFGYECFSRFDGDFALVISDEYRGEILLARSRRSSRPLYYFLEKNKLIFSSEIKGILRAVGGAVRLNEKKLQDHLFAPVGTYSGVDIYADINEISQGKCLVVSEFGTRFFDCVSASNDKEYGEDLIIPDVSISFDVRRILAESFIAFDIPQFDMFMPSVMNAIRAESEKGKRAVRITDGARKYSDSYIKEREDRLGGFFGVRFCSIYQNIESTDESLYINLDSELERIVSACDTRVLEGLYGKGIVEKVRSERTIEARIRMTGMLCQSEFLAHTQPILLCSEEGTRDIYASRLSTI